MPRRLLALIASAALLPACANHVRYTKDSFESSLREIVHAETVVRPNLRLLTAAQIELELLADETVVVHQLRTRVRIDENTPYNSGYELWEVPVGSVCLPVLLLLRMVDFVGLGFVSDAKLDAFAGWTFAAINPLLNVESESRRRRSQVSHETEELGREVSRELRPLPGEKVLLSLDAEAPRSLTSDEHGRVTMDLLALAPDRLPGRPRRLRVSVEAEGKRERLTVEFPLSRELSVRLGQALNARRLARARDVSPEAELRGRKSAKTALPASLDPALKP
jgi:hypothetical protein